MVPILVLAIALSFSGKPITVHCGGLTAQGVTDAAGWAIVGGNQLGITQDRCNTIRTQKLKGNPQYLIGSLIVLLHEVGHTTGISKEACAEKFAVQRLPITLHIFYHVRYHSPEMHKFTGIGTTLERDNIGTEYDWRKC